MSDTEKDEGVTQVVCAFARREAVEQAADALPGGIEGALLGLAQQGLELGEDLLDRIEIGRVGRQEQQVGACGVGGFAHGAALVRAEVVHDDGRPTVAVEDLSPTLTPVTRVVSSPPLLPT